MARINLTIKNITAQSEIEKIRGTVENIIGVATWKKKKSSAVNDVAYVINTDVTSEEYRTKETELASYFSKLYEDSVIGGAQFSYTED